MEVVIILMLVLISIELALIIIRMTEEKEKEETNPRREIEGIFKDPLGDMYRKNAKGLYRPVRPQRGDEDEDEDL